MRIHENDEIVTKQDLKLLEDLVSSIENKIHTILNGNETSAATLVDHDNPNVKKTTLNHKTAAASEQVAHTNSTMEARAFRNRVIQKVSASVGNGMPADAIVAWKTRAQRKEDKGFKAEFVAFVHIPKTGRYVPDVRFGFSSVSVSDSYSNHCYY